MIDAAGSQWAVRSLELAEELTWTTPCGLELSAAPATVAKLDFSRGKIIFLSDLAPESVTFTPYFGNGKDLPLLARFYAPRSDKSLESGPLQLKGTQYAKGLALHSRTEIVYRLPGRFRRFKAIAGIDDGVRPAGHVELTIRGDDEVLWDRPLGGSDDPEPIDLDLTGVRRISILVDYGEKLDVADHLDLCEARITK